MGSPPSDKQVRLTVNNLDRFDPRETTEPVKEHPRRNHHWTAEPGNQPPDSASAKHARPAREGQRDGVCPPSKPLQECRDPIHQIPGGIRENDMDLIPEAIGLGQLSGDLALAKPSLWEALARVRKGPDIAQNRPRSFEVETVTVQSQFIGACYRKQVEHLAGVIRDPDNTLGSEK